MNRIAGCFNVCIIRMKVIASKNKILDLKKDGLKQCTTILNGEELEDLYEFRYLGMKLSKDNCEKAEAES